MTSLYVYADFDWLDSPAMGGFRFTKTKGCEFINVDPNLRVPPLTSVRELMQAAHEIALYKERMGTLTGI